MSIEAMKRWLSAIEYMTKGTISGGNEQTKQAIEEMRQAIEQAEQVDKEGSPCPEFWDWLPKAYRFEGDGSFTKYNMEVAFLAGKQAIKQAEQVQPEQLAKLGWQEIDCPICGGGARAFPKPEHARPMANEKLKVTLQDTPTEIERAQYKRMFEAACSALGAIGEALGVGEDEGGAEPILAAIAELKAVPPPRQPLTDEAKAVIDAARAAMDDSVEAYDSEGSIKILSHLAASLSLCLDEYDRAIEADHGIKEKT